MSICPEGCSRCKDSHGKDAQAFENSMLHAALAGDNEKMETLMQSAKKGALVRIM
jgi:hypothetical protein